MEINVSFETPKLQSVFTIYCYKFKIDINDITYIGDGIAFLASNINWFYIIPQIMHSRYCIIS